MADIRDPAVGTSRHSATHPVARARVSLGLAAIETLVSNQDNSYIDDPCTVRRTIFVPANDVSSIDFDITAQQREALYQQGLQAGQDFLKTWNFTDYLKACGAPVKPSPQADGKG